MSLTRTAKQHVPLAWRKNLKWARARAFERLGSDRYSRPALYDIESAVLPLLPARGVFLEIGANDGFDQSNTYFLARHRGWPGILVEPLPDRFETCRRRRPESYCVRAACVGPTYPEDEVVLADDDLMSVAVNVGRGPVSRQTGGAPRLVRAPASTLSQVIRSSPFDHIDFMSVDVEGAELDVLAGLDMTLHAPDVLLIETESLGAVRAALEPWMRLVAQPTYHDYLFVRLPASDRTPTEGG